MRGKYNTKTRQEKNEEFIESRDFNRLLINNRPFIQSMAKAFNQPENYDDLCQVGEIALHKAFETFNPGLKVSFLAYAKTIIKNDMNSFSIKYGNVVRPPIKAIREKKVTKKTISMDAPVNENGDPMSDLIPSEVSNPQNEFGFVITALNEFSEKDQEIIKMRYGIKPYEKEHTLEEISLVYHVTRECIRLKINKIQKALNNNERLRKTYQANR